EEPEEDSASSQVEEGQNSMPEEESPGTDENEELQSKVDQLPDSTRKILKDDYQATFLGVEKIDEDKLI
ncbi:MAG: hypothetical protein AAEJ57_05390, partial [Opitutales bacterium]